MMNTRKLVTHNGSFHADEIFATATLAIFLEKKGESFEIIRTRDPEIIKEGDYVYDVGGVYDEAKNLFDHHQKDFNERRLISKPNEEEHSILLSSFGLIWKKFGAEVSGGEKEKQIIEEHLVAPIDASDNGFDLVENKYDISPYYLQYMFFAMLPTWREEKDTDEVFKEAVVLARKILEREIIQAKDYIVAEDEIEKIYNDTEDKRIIVLEGNYFYENLFSKYTDVLFAIYPKKDSDTWGVRAIREDVNSFKNRKDFPVPWAGLRDEELAKVTGVEDAVFCHKALFLAVAKSKEGAIKLANLALIE